MPSVAHFFLFLFVGLLFSVAFYVLAKVRLTRLCRFAVDFSLSTLACAAFYAPCFFLADGIIRPAFVVATIIGFALPRLFLPLNRDVKKRGK